MTSLRALSVPAVLLFLAAPAGEQEIVFSVDTGTTLERTLESRYALDLESFSVEIDGEEIPPEELGDFDMRMEHDETLTIVDVFEEVDEGAPRRVRRTYETLDAKDTTSFEAGDAQDGGDTEYESGLEGQSVLFTWDAEEGAFAASFAEGSEGDSELLEGLREDMDLRRLLPGRAVAEGDSWDVDPAAFESVMDPGGDVALVDPEAEDSEDDVDEDELRENLEGELTATFRGTRDEDGVRVAVIELAAATRTHTESDMDLGEDAPDGASATRRVEIEFDVEGELLWDLEHGHPHSLELSGTHGMRMIESIEASDEEGSFEQTQAMDFAGDVRFAMRVARR